MTLRPRAAAAVALPFVLGLAVVAPVAHAQASNDYGSPYSRFGLGERAEFGSPQAAMMGSAGAASLGGPLVLGIENPALVSDLVLTSFLAGADVRRLHTEDALGGEARATAGGVATVALGLPLLPDRLGLSVSMAPYSRVNYRVVEEDSVDVPGGSPAGYRLNYEGNGGLTRVRVGLGARPAGGLRIGAGVDVVFGRVEYLQRTEFPGRSDLAEVRIGRTTRLSGVTGTVGAAYRARVGEARTLHLGADVTLPARLTGARVRTLGASLDADTLSVEREGGVTLPLTARAGASLAGRHWTFAAEGLYEPWSGLESDFAWGGYDPVGGADGLRDRMRVGAGLQVIPGGGDRMSGYFARTAYRLGAYAERGLAGPDGTDITTMAVTGGLSLPTLFQATRLDLGLEAGTRGATEGVLVRDLFLRGTVSITFGERWFVRRRIG